jgi:hypothetical protein
MKKGITAEVLHYTIHLYNRKENNLPPHFRALPKLNCTQNSQKNGRARTPKHQTIIPERRCILEYQISKYPKNLIACQVEPNAEHCQLSWPQSLKTLECFPELLLSVATL